MVTVFASFMLGEDRIIKLFGLGLASAVFIDAVIIRSVLVPAIMQLFGRRAWWFPDWLGRILPRLHVEPAEGDPAPTGEHPVVAARPTELADASRGRVAAPAELVAARSRLAPVERGLRRADQIAAPLRGIPPRHPSPALTDVGRRSVASRRDRPASRDRRQRFASGGGDREVPRSPDAHGVPSSRQQISHGGCEPTGPRADIRDASPRRARRPELVALGQARRRRLLQRLRPRPSCERRAESADARDRQPPGAADARRPW